MKETAIIEGKYSHPEGLTYQVFGLAGKVEKQPENSASMGVALGVAGYEQTHEVKGDQIQVFKSDQGYTFIPLGQFDCPDEIVWYMQLENGERYKAGQLWWRPPENFQEYFTLATSIAD